MLYQSIYILKKQRIQRLLKDIIVLSVIVFFTKGSFAQAPTVQDCGGAIPICQNIYSELNSYSGTGNINPEINAYPGPSCATEDNSVWYTFTAQTTGNFNFILTPNDLYDDYDWSVYNLTNATCADIYTTPSLEISCNSYGTLGYNGTTGASSAMGGYGNSNGPGDLNGPPFNQSIAVTAGSTYVMMVSNWTGSPNGYTINFSTSTATIFDNVPPHIESIVSNISCGASNITFNFSENIDCSTISTCDMTLTGPGGPYSITNITGAGCAAGADQENTYTITFNPPVTTGGNFNLALDSSVCGSVTDLCGNIAPSGSLPFVINLPVPNAGADQTVCAGTSVTLTASGGTNYSWSSGVVNGVPFTPAISNTYTVTVSDPAGCSATDDVLVTVNPLPVANAGADQTICSGENVTLNASGGATYSWNNGVTDGVSFSPASTNTYTVTVTNGGCSATDDVLVTVNASITAYAGADQTICIGAGVTLAASGGNSYTWNNGVTDGVPFFPASSNTYTVTVSSGNCSATDDLLVTVNPLPNASAGANQSACVGSSVTLTATGGTNYVWDNGVSNGIPFIPLTTNTYFVTVTDANNCSATSSVSVQVVPIPVVNIGNDTLLCPDESIVLDAANQGASFLWSNGDNTQSTTVSNPGQYWVIVANGNCSSSDTVNILVSPEINLGRDVSLCQNFEVMLDAGNPSLSYLWSTGEKSQWIKVETAGEYWVTSGYQHCRLSDTIMVTGGITSIYFPSGFTPDYDLTNDIFMGYGEGITYFNLKIFDRWGGLIFETSDMNSYWDGKINSNKAPVGIYVWKVDYRTDCTGERVLRKYGSVMLLR